MRLIGINGFKRAGKGETGNAIFDQFDGVVYQIGFADKLKIMAARALGFVRPPQDLIALMDEMKETASLQARYYEPGGYSDQLLHDLTVREYLQNFGNDARELFGTNFWIDQVLPYPGEVMLSTNEALNDRYPDVDLVAITDLRYPNEAQRVRDLGGEVWEIVRPGLVSDGHASETPLPNELITRRIDNDGSVSDLRRKVAAILDEEFRPW